MSLKQKQEDRLQELLAYEKVLWQKGFHNIAGMDEAGRGPLAGPVVAACVVMPAESFILGIDDSKKISEPKRETLYEEIIASACSYGIGVVEHEEIDRVNILNATKLAFAKAYENCGKNCDYLLIDGRDVIKCNCTAEAVIKGDGTCYSIAAASIIAKVFRDRLMRAYDTAYPEYGFAKHKGYGTKEHTHALLEYGPCAIHRKTFITNFTADEYANP